MQASLFLLEFRSADVCRSMYQQSYFSFLWNRMVNHRLGRYGFRLVPGDLVLVATHGGGREGPKRQVMDT